MDIKQVPHVVIETGGEKIKKSYEQIIERGGIDPTIDGIAIATHGRKYCRNCGKPMRRHFVRQDGFYTLWAYQCTDVSCIGYMDIEIIKEWGI